MEAEWYGTLDLRAGYWQLLVDPADIPKKVVINTAGLHEFLRMPFGLKNAPHTMQRALDVLLAGYTYKSCLVNLDDIIIFGKDFDQYLQRQTTILELLRGSKLNLQPKKCHFGFNQVDYLGHVVTGKGVATDPKKVDAVVRFPRPGTSR